MLHAFGWHGSVFIDTVGHCVGAVLFGLLIVLFLRGRRFGKQPQNGLSVLAASLVFLWNVGELVVLGTGGSPQRAATTVSFCALSILPAVLLHISLQGKLKGIAVVGYLFSLAGILLQYLQRGVPGSDRSRLSLLLLSFGFALLSLGAWFWAERHAAREPGAEPNRVAFLSLAIFATSFLHFQAGHATEVWVGEAVWHHAAIPIALIVLLHNYRFLLLDVFLRFAVSVLYIAFWLWTVAIVDQRFQLWALASRSDFARGLMLTAIGFLLYLLARSLRRIQLLMTTVAFRRRPLDTLIHSLQTSAGDSESELLDRTASEIARYFECKRHAVQLDGTNSAADKPILLDRLRQRTFDVPEWAITLLPVRFSKGDRCRIFLGSRAGGRRYLSEDMVALQQAGIALTERIERLRSEQVGQLVSQAELRALQAQINPHFFFNALNTLYGTIGRGSPEARRLVLNLAEVFRARLQTTRTYVPLAEELDIVRAYLEIEALRLGDRLTTEINVEDNLSSVIIPVLIIQPLVENAIRHGLSPDGSGFVQLTIAERAGYLQLRVRDKGRGFSGDSKNAGIGLDNVRKRLKLCYGADIDLQIDSSKSGSTVSFLIPNSRARRPDSVETNLKASLEYRPSEL